MLGGLRLGHDETISILTGNIYTVKNGAEWDDDSEIVIIEEEMEAETGLLDLPYLSD
jgi:hypothetical protein